MHSLSNKQQTRKVSPSVTVLSINGSNIRKLKYAACIGHRACVSTKTVLSVTQKRAPIDLKAELNILGADNNVDTAVSNTTIRRYRIVHL